MSASTRISVANLWQFLEHRNSEIKDKVASIFVKNAKRILMNLPFSFCESISSEVAEGIVNYGDKLMCNALIEEDSERKVEEVNDIGDEFQAIRDSVTLKVICENEPEKLNHRSLNLLTKDDSDISVSKAASLQDALQVVREFLRTKARQGFTAIIEMLCDCNEDGFVFASGQTVPVEVLESHIQTTLNDGIDQMLPMVVDLMVKDGQCLQISQIQPSRAHVDRYIMNS